MKMKCRNKNRLLHEHTTKKNPYGMHWEKPPLPTSSAEQRSSTEPPPIRSLTRNLCKHSSVVNTQYFLRICKPTIPVNTLPSCTIFLQNEQKQLLSYINKGHLLRWHRAASRERLNHITPSHKHRSKTTLYDI